MPTLTREDERILRRGYISEGRYISGGITGSIVGFGVGHAIQGRYQDAGWIFTAGEGASKTLIVIAALSCFGDPPPGETCMIHLTRRKFLGALPIGFHSGHSSFCQP